MVPSWNNPQLREKTQGQASSLFIFSLATAKTHVCFRKSGDLSRSLSYTRGRVTKHPRPVPHPASPPFHQAAFGLIFRCFLHCYWHNILSVQLIIHPLGVWRTTWLSQRARGHSKHLTAPRKHVPNSLSCQQVRGTTLGNLKAPWTLLQVHTGARPHFHTLSVLPGIRKHRFIPSELGDASMWLSVHIWLHILIISEILLNKTLVVYHIIYVTISSLFQYNVHVTV